MKWYSPSISAVWKQLAPGGSRKAAAATITPANKAVRKRKPKAVSTRKGNVTCVCLCRNERTHT